MPPSSVILRNHGPKPFRQMYAGEWHAVSAGEMIVIPWAAACLWFGNPDLHDIPGDNEPSHKYRSIAVNDLHVRYGTISAAFFADEQQRTLEDSHGDNVPTNLYFSLDELADLGYTPAPGIAATYKYRHPNLPLVTLHQATAKQERIYMVVDDPFGEADALVAATAAGAESSAKTMQLVDQLAKQQQELEALKAMVANLAPSTAEAILSTSDSVVALAPAPPAPDAGTIAQGDTGDSVNVLDPAVADIFADEKKKAAAPRKAAPQSAKV